MSLKINAAAALAVIGTPSIKGNPLKAGQSVTPVRVIAGAAFKNNRGQEVIAQNILCTVDGKFVTIPVGELAKMTGKGGAAVIDLTTNSEDLTIKSFKVEGSTDRQRNGAAVYPIGAYAEVKAYLDSQNSDSPMTYDELVKSGLRDGNTLQPLQDYTVVID